VRYSTQIADALAHAHDRGVIHRDLKSSNIVLTRDGRAKVLDFGLARRLSGHELEEATHSADADADAVGGTLAYMAPELLRGESADARTDVWALGVVLYEMASGHLPFRGQTGFALTAAILEQAPAPIASRPPSSLRAIVDRCLAKDPAARYQRASDLRAALETIRTTARRRAGPPAGARLARGHSEPLRRWRRRFSGSMSPGCAAGCLGGLSRRRRSTRLRSFRWRTCRAIGSRTISPTG
jgi:serine/threonine protein kinase